MAAAEVPGLELSSSSSWDLAAHLRQQTQLLVTLMLPLTGAK
jgi:hypothetical protein